MTRAFTTCRPSTHAIAKRPSGETTRRFAPAMMPGMVRLVSVVPSVRSTVASLDSTFSTTTSSAPGTAATVVGAFPASTVFTTSEAAST